MSQPLKRILAAIMFTDIQGYTAMMQKDESSAMGVRSRHRQIFNECMSQYEGEILQYFGDGTLSIFYSSVDAVLCAIDMQTKFLSDPAIPVRIGIHSGDIVYNNEEIIGDGVNVASRLESIAIAGSLLISGRVYDEIKNHQSILSHFIGKVLLKNLSDPLQVYSIVNSPIKIPSLEDLGKKGRVRPRTIAVLPFVNIGNREEDEFFSDGVTEEILNVLAKINALQVTSRTSSFYFKNKNLNIKDIGKSLNVEYVLEGSVRKAGQKVRITAQLIQTTDDYHLWSQHYDRNLEDIFAIQDEIAREISIKLVKELNIKVDVVKPRRKINVDAHNALLKGKYHFNKWSPESMNASILSYKEAIAYDPEYAEAYAGLASCYIFLGITGYDSSGIQEALIFAEKGYEINPENEDCILALAMVRSLFEKKKRDAEILFTRALQINPDNATAHHYYAMHLGHIGSLDQALIEYHRALELDPLSLIINSEYGSALAMTGHVDKALDQINKTIELNKNFRSAWEAKGWIYFQMKEYEHSLEAFTTYQGLTGSKNKGLTGLAIVNAKIGKTAKAREYLDIMLERKMTSPEIVIDIDLSMVYLGLDEIDKSLDHLEYGLSTGQGSLFVNTLPFFRKLDGNRRFEEIKLKYLPKD